MEKMMGFKEAQQRSEAGLAYTKEGKRLENPKKLMVNDVMSVLGELGSYQAENIKKMLDAVDEEIIIKKNMYVLAVTCMFRNEHAHLTKTTLDDFKKQHSGLPFGVTEIDLVRYFRALNL